jgi:hypothetical protein
MDNSSVQSLVNFLLGQQIIVQNENAILKKRLTEAHETIELLATLPRNVLAVPSIEELKKDLENAKKKLQTTYEESLPYK